MKKVLIALLMIAVLATSMYAGGRKDNKTTSTTGRAKITFMTQDFEGSPLTGAYADQVKQKMAEYTNTDVEFIWVGNDAYTEKTSLTLASPETMPMIMSIGGMTMPIIDAANAGAFWDLSEFIYDSAKYPNLSQANRNVNESLTVGGKLIGVYRARDIGRQSLGYRADWAEKLGLGEPKTVEDVYNMMYQFTYGDPDGNGKNDTYGLALCKYTGPFDIMQTWFGCGNGWAEENGKLVPVHQTKAYKEALDWFRKMYEDGLVYSDWAVRDTSTWEDSVKKGECGMFCDTIDGSRRCWDYFINNNIPSVVDPSKPASMKLLSNVAGKTLATSGYNGFFVITKAAKTKADVEACLHYLDKMCDNDMIILAAFGLEGIHWEEQDGYLVDLDSADKLSAKNYSALNQTQAFIPLGEPNNPPVKKSDTKLVEAATKAEAAKYAVFNPALSFLINSDTYATNGGVLDEIISSARTQYICGQIDEAGLKAAWDKWTKQGGAEVIKEVNAQYAKNKK